LPEKFFDSARKNCYANLQNYFARLTLPSNYGISKNPGFRSLYIASQNEFRFFSFNKYKNKYFFSFLAAGFCLKNLAFAQKMMVLPESGGGLQHPNLLARTPMHSYIHNTAQMLRRQSASKQYTE